MTSEEFKKEMECLKDIQNMVNCKYFERSSDGKQIKIWMEDGTVNSYQLRSPNAYFFDGHCIKLNSTKQIVQYI